ncbi:hypothetical protein ACS5PU_08225 [Pedobacter sp. GSP4]|uniref:hypothetical protein n=1 Tax=Pedobacter sp. GSP4 TaxID=3453716 RepID=UPI003EEA24F3
MIIDFTIENLARLGINDEDKIMFLWLAHKSVEEPILEYTDFELATALKKHITTINRGIKRLSNANLVVRSRLNGIRVIALSENANSLIINKNKINNLNYLFIKQDNSISINDCKEVAKHICDCFSFLNTEKMCSYLISRASEAKEFKKIRTAVQLKAVLYSVINKASKNDLISMDTELPEPELALKSIQNTICIICGLDGSQIITEVEEEQCRRIKQRDRNERVLRKGIIESYKEKTIDISQNPKELQQAFNRRKLVSITAELHQMYKRGNPPFYNLVLKDPQSGMLIYASILQKHIIKMGAKFKGYNGLIKVSGEVYYSSYHKDTFGIKNIIRSIDELKPVEFLEEQLLVDTTLLDPDNAPF